MADGSEGSTPQVFVVDSKANYVAVASQRNLWWTRAGHKCLLLLVGLSMFGLVIQGCLIYNLYKRMEDFPHCTPQPGCWNNSNPSAQQDGVIMGRVGPQDSNNIAPVEPTVKEPEQRPLAHLKGSIGSVGNTNVVQWEFNISGTSLQQMGYSNGSLLIQRAGYYSLYSKVTLNVAEECWPIQHKVLRKTLRYGNPILLMKSKSFRCLKQRSSGSKSPDAEDLWNSFLGGIFQLDEGDKVYVTVDNIQTMRPGPTENMMGALFVSP